MASVKLRIDGLVEFNAALRALPEDLRDEAAGIVTDHVEAAATAIRAAYPIGPRRFFRKLGYEYFGGNLRKGVESETTTGRFGVRVLLRNKAKHAWIFENGTELRKKGRGDTGRMPAGRVFIPIVIRERRAMRAELRALVERAGFRVSG